MKISSKELLFWIPIVIRVAPWVFSPGYVYYFWKKVPNPLRTTDSDTRLLKSTIKECANHIVLAG